MGDTTTLFGRVRPRMVMGENRTLAIGRTSFQCGKLFLRLRMILAENRFPSPIRVENMPCGIMR